MPRAKSTTATGEKKTTTRSKKAAAPSTSAPVNGTAIEVVNNVEDRIRARAYELYEGRGRQHGSHEGDWFTAEAEVRNHHA